MLTTVTLLCGGETCTSISVSELSSPALRPTCRTSCWCLLSPARRSTPATRMFSGAPGGAADVPASTRLTMWLTYPVSAQPAPATNSTRAETMPPVTRSDAAAARLPARHDPGHEPFLGGRRRSAARGTGRAR